MFLRRFPIEYQMDSQDCGPASLKIIAKHFGKHYSLQYLRECCGITKDGVSLLNLSTGAERIGLRTLAIKCTIDDVVNSIPFPAIIFWENSHFIVVYHSNKEYIWVSDPAKGRIRYTHEEFRCGWYQKNENTGILLAVEPTADFYNYKAEKKQKRNSFTIILKYFYPYKSNFCLIFVIMLIVTALQGILPFISKAMIDVGIKTSNIRFIYMMLIGNIAILLSIMLFNILRDWILMNITTRVNIALISDNLIKLMKLPVTFFENKRLGDIQQRAKDHERIRSFIMNYSLPLVSSTLTFVIFTLILLFYNSVIFLIFLVGSFLYVCWILFFLRIRKKLDWRYFELLSQNHRFGVETVSAIQDIKIYNYEKHHHSKWKEIQARLYHINKRIFAVTNTQNLGAHFIESIMNMAIVFFCAMAVMRDEITFGIMISTQFIIGMLNGSLVQFTNFVAYAQYAKNCFLRINEIRSMEDEEELLSTGKTTVLPDKKTIRLENVQFQYSVNTPLVLRNISLQIPENKVTALVGKSGSGKSTLLKLLVRLYKPTYGEIKMDTMNVNLINLHQWRDMCGVVMQDGTIFSDTILNNIILDDDHIDYNWLREVCHITQIVEDIHAMPKGIDTTIGKTGRELSGGQKQRLLIARALYRNPKYLFLDEAMNSLDAINERKITEAMNGIFKQRTVVVIAHRLSTIRNADQIVVLDKGFIMEVGNHETLMEKKGHYYNLVQAQTNQFFSNSE